MAASLRTPLIVLCITLFALLFHDPQSSISDDIRHTTIMEQFYRHGKVHLKDTGTPGINEMQGADGKIYSASNLGPSLWYYTVFLLGKGFNHLVTLPIELRPRCNYIGNIDGEDFSENRHGDWAPVFARLANALLFPLSFLLLLQIAPLSAWGPRYASLYPWTALFGTQWLLLNHSNYDHSLNGFGLLLAVASAAIASRKQWPIRWLLLAGFGMAISITTRQFSIIYMPLISAWIAWELWRAKCLRRLPFVLLPALAGVALNLVYNHLRSGSLFTTGYDPKWIQFHSVMKGLQLYGLSGSQSVLFFSPLLILGIFGALIYGRKYLRNIFALLLLSLTITHLGFYLVWGYVGGNQVPLRFVSEIFFIGAFFIPAEKFRSVRLAVIPLTLWGMISSVLLSFLDFRRLPVSPTSFSTWKTPRSLSNQFALAEDTYRLFQDVEYSVRTGTPDWLIYLLGGKSALIIATVVVAGIGVAVLVATERRLRKYSLAALCPAAVLTIGCLLACPDSDSSGPRVSTSTCDLQDLHLEAHHGFLVFSGKIAVRDSSIKSYCLRLQHKKHSFVQSHYCSTFTFGASYYKTNSLPVSKNRGDLADFREFISLPATFPGGDYEATIALEGTSTTMNCTLPDSTPLVRQAGYLDFTHWVQSDTMEPNHKIPFLMKNSYAFVAFHLPFEAAKVCKGTVYISDTANCELLSSESGMTISAGSEGQIQFQFPSPQHGQSVTIAVKAKGTSATLAGVYLEPVK